VTEIDQEQVSEAMMKCDEEKTLRVDLSRYKTEASRYCLTPDCILTTSVVLRRMDFTVDPCDDFWRYSCGGWLQDRQNEPVGQQSWGVELDAVEARIRQHIRQWLDSPAQCDVGDRTTTTDCKMRQLYSRCVDTQTLDVIGAKPLQDILDDFGGWSAHGLKFTC